MYNRRAILDGSVEDRLRQAIQAAGFAAAALEKEPEFTGKLRFDRKRWEVIINDRALAPNTEETWNTLEPALRTVFDETIGLGQYAFERSTDPRELFQFTVKGI
jgi:hypothetical protein